MALPQYFLQELKSRSDLSDIAASYVNLKRQGKNLVGLCPFHNEKTGSFNIYPENGSFYCFGCGAGGDVITFIMKIENLDYIEAVRFLAQRTGLQMPEDGVDDSMSKLRTRILEINRETARFFYSSLKSQEGKIALDYLLKRGLTPQTIKKFGLGYSPSGGFELTNHLRAKGFTAEEIIQANVAGRSRNGNPYDRFRSRVMFPIIDLRGNVVAFGGRALLPEEKAKYINTSDTPVYHKSNMLFAMNFAKNSNSRQLILAEGYMDVISLHQAGFENTVASLGTAFTDEQARLMARHADEVVICYDSDDAGQRAAQKAIGILRKTGLFVKVLAVPGNKDPDEYIQSYGKDGHARFKALLEGAGNDIEYKLYKIKEKYDIETNEGKTKYLRECLPVLAGIDDLIEREVYAGNLSKETEVDKKAILEMATKERSKLNQKRYRDNIKSQNEVVAAKSAVNTEKRKNTSLTNAEEGLIAYLIGNSEEIIGVSQKLPPEKFVTSFCRRIYTMMIEKAEHGEVSLTALSEQLSAEETSELARILAVHNEPPITSKEASGFITQLEHSVIVNDDEIKNSSADEYREIFEKIRNQKNRGTK